MIDTSRIQSGFDAELMIGSEWFLTAVQTLIANGVLQLPAGVSITAAAIIDDPDWDLSLTTNLGIVVQARLTIDNGQFLFVTDFNNTSFQIDLPSFGRLAAPPVLQKVLGDDDHENAIALLLNLDIRASSQKEDPLPAGEHLDRGDPADALSFLPNGQHIALGLARDSFTRFANNIWHTELRDTDGSHPLPKVGEDKKGDWHRVKLSMTKQRIKFILEGEVPIDFWPDADVDLALTLKPKLVDGKLTFAVDTDLDIDTGFWGDLLAFTIGALVGFLIAIFTGGLLLIPAIGVGAVILLEIGEFVAGEVIERMITAKDKDGNLISGLLCEDQVLQLASPQAAEDGISIGALDAIPTSIPIFVDEDDPLFRRMVTVASHYDEIELNGKGLAIAGKSEPAEMFQPLVARLVESIYDQEELTHLRYELTDANEEAILDMATVFERLSGNELQPPLSVLDEMDDPVFQIPSGRLCCPCLTPTHIRREDSVITRIKFSTGLELNTQDAVALQDKAGIYLENLQLIHPSNGNPYFRAPANTTTADNFESLPEF